MTTEPTVDPALPVEERGRLVTAIVERYLATNDGEALLRTFEPLVITEGSGLWRRYTWPPGWEYNDVLQECRVELLRLAAEWNRRTPFLPYLSGVYHWRVVNRMRQVRRHQQWELDYDHHILVEMGPAAKDDPESLVLLAELWRTLTPLQRHVASAMVGVPKNGKEVGDVTARRELQARMGVTLKAIRAVQGRTTATARSWADGAERRSPGNPNWRGRNANG